MILLILGMIMKFIENSTQNKNKNVCKNEKKMCSKHYGDLTFCDCLLSSFSMYSEPYYTTYETNSINLLTQHDQKQKRIKHLREYFNQKGFVKSGMTKNIFNSSSLNILEEIITKPFSSNPIESSILNNELGSEGIDNLLNILNSLYANINNNKMVTTPESDYNSNSTPPKFAIGGMVGALNCSINSSHDFSHDNSDYQWFVDYGCREGFTHQSVLSSLCESYAGINELSYYDDIARHLDANLAEVDIESFRAEDMNSLLSKIPKISKTDKYSSEFDNSIYKSELLFSPIKESHISVDSLDLESYQDNGDIILTCKANKNNYTIAFEGSVLYSDESFYAEPDDINHFKHNCNLNIQTKCRKNDNASMTKSAHSFTTWSKLKQNSTPLQRYSSGNNNIRNLHTHHEHLPKCSLKKCSSLPNIKETMQQLSSSLLLDDPPKIQNSKNHDLPMCHVPELSSTQNESNNHLSTNDASTSISTEQKVTQQPAFNLVKLFIQQKSSSTDTCMDVSSGCWPSTDGSSNSSMEKDRLKKKIMNDSGKSSSISRHEKDIPESDEHSFQLDSLDILDKNLTGSKKIVPEKSNQISPKTQMKNHHICNILNNNYYRNNTLDNNGDRYELSNMITKSIQTSNYTQPQPPLKFIPPSFLANLSKLGDKKKAPVYVIYPNYALPDLNFVNSTSTVTDIIFSPYKLDSFNKTSSESSKVYENEDLILKNIKPDHIKDWKSLVLLLPTKYRKKLKQIPEANFEIDLDLSLTPMFCMSPPIKRNKKEICDCLKYVIQATTNSSLSGSSEKPPSSGYRGSSTIMTDSELDSNHYKYESKHTVSFNNSQKWINAQPRTPRSILRKRQPSCSSIGKRNSMFDKQNTTYDSRQLTNIEKRLSLPESFMYQEKQYCDERDEALARVRAENFLLNIPKSELKYYEEIAHILNSDEIPTKQYDPFKLKTEVSKALSQKRVSFTENVYPRFATPPNSPNISVANMRVSNHNKKQKSLSQKDLSSSDQNKMDKISSNRFKRLQIQWELLSKESSMLFELANENQTKSGGSTPINDRPKSKIPRPVSYPSSKTKYETPTRLPSLQPQVKLSGKTMGTHIAASSAAKQKSGSGRSHNKGVSNTLNNKKKNISEKQI